VQHYDLRMNTEESCPVLLGALRLAKARVTGDDLDAKDRQLERIADMTVRLRLVAPPGDIRRPTAAELTELLGDPDDAELRAAIRAWA
jgi:hypothetical protein